MEQVNFTVVTPSLHSPPYAPLTRSLPASSLPFLPASHPSLSFRPLTSLMLHD